jgi:hypothetical protein
MATCWHDGPKLIEIVNDLRRQKVYEWDSLARQGMKACDRLSFSTSSELRRSPRQIENLLSGENFLSSAE